MAEEILSETPTVPPVKEGTMTQELCEAQGGIWNPDTNTCELPPKPSEEVVPLTTEDLLRKNEMLRAQLKVREDQLRQAIAIANRANQVEKARDEAEKTRLINSIMMDGKFDRDELVKKPLAELETMRMTLDKSLQKTFVNVAAELDQQRRSRKPLLTVGAWDSRRKCWVNGAN